MGYAVAQLLEALHHNRKVAGSILLQTSSPAVDSACNRNKYQGNLLGGKGGRCIGLTAFHLNVPNV
jgi:hypothetical protein